MKQRSNLKKHGVEFADAAVALEDEHALTVLDEDSETEYRFQTLCMGAVPDVLMVFHTEEIDGVTCYRTLSQYSKMMTPYVVHFLVQLNAKNWRLQILHAFYNILATQHA